MSIRESAMIVHIEFSFWTGNKLDKDASKKANALFNAKGNASRVTKYLLDPDNLKQCRSSKTAIGQLFRQYTVPWLYNGTGLLPSKLFNEFRQKLDDLIVIHNFNVDLFCQKYLAFKDSRKADMGTLYKESEYPSVNKIRNMFKVKVSFEPVPTSEDFRCDIQESDLRQIRDEMEDQLKDGLQTTTLACWKRLYEVVKHFASILENEKSRVFESTIEKVQEVCSILSALNVANDPNLEKLRKEVSAKLAVREVGDLKTDMVFRAVKADAAKTLLTKMDKFFNAKDDNSEDNE